MISKRAFYEVRWAILLIFSVSLFISCSKDDRDYLKNWEMRECHYDQDWDETTLSQAVIGEWEWLFVRSYSSETDFDLYEDLELNFRSDNIVEVQWGTGSEEVEWRYRNSMITIDSGQFFNPVANNKWFYLCDDEMMFVNWETYINVTTSNTFIKK